MTFNTELKANKTMPKKKTVTSTKAPDTAAGASSRASQGSAKFLPEEKFGWTCETGEGTIKVWRGTANGRRAYAIKTKHQSGNEFELMLSERGAAGMIMLLRLAVCGKEISPNESRSATSHE